MNGKLSNASNLTKSNQGQEKAVGGGGNAEVCAF